MSIKKKSTPYILVLPSLLLLFAIVIFPLFFTLRNSFMYYNLQTNPNPMGFVGIANYKIAFTDPTFFTALFNTLKISFIGTFIELVFGFAIALVLYENVKGSGKIRAIIIMPITVAPMVAGFIFRYLFYSDGLISFILSSLGVNMPPEGILGTSRTVLGGILLTDVWEWTPFFAIILLAGLQSISLEIIEAAKVDGASYFYTLRKVILPNMSFVLAMVILIRFMQLFNLFDIIYAETRGGPGAASRTLSYNLYYSGLVEYNVGYSSALAVIMIVIAAVFINIFISVFFKNKEI